MKILVTGASGFTGQHFVKHAQKQQHEVVPLTADLRDQDALLTEITHIQPDAVVHLAAVSFVEHAHTSDFYSINVAGTLHLLDALTELKQPPKQVLLASSANVYGNQEHSPIDEKKPPMPINHYGMSKLAMEYLARNYLNRLPIFFTRPFNYTGQGQAKSFLIPKLVTHFANRAQTIELGNLEIEREFNDVRFVCEAYLRLLQKAKPGDIYNICSNQPVSPQSIIHLLSELTQHQPQIKINPNYVRAKEIQCLCGDPAKLQQTVGHIPLPNLRDTLLWMLKNQAEKDS